MSDAQKALFKLRAYFVHAFTACGSIAAFLAAMEICKPDSAPKNVFLWLFAAVAIDACDGPLARRWDVKRHAPGIDGRTMDDIIDFLTYTFLPLLLVWKMGWAPLVPVFIAILVSLFGFANIRIKQETDGFFLGFPSYWNVFAFYAGPLFLRFGTTLPAILLVSCAILTLLPVRFVYPNLAPPPWRLPILAGAALWAGFLFYLLWNGYPHMSDWILLISLLYPAFYLTVSIYLDFNSRRKRTMFNP